jgi:hypothetical protein
VRLGGFLDLDGCSWRLCGDAGINNPMNTSLPGFIYVAYAVGQMKYFIANNLYANFRVGKAVNMREDCESAKGWEN